MPAMSCCIIAKNEADRLPSLLQEISAVCEQVVLIDTGSTDDTPRLAEKYGAEVGFFPWNDSFSDARNRSLEMARHPWIIYLDADDVIPENALHGLADLKKRSPDKAYGFIINSTQDGITGMVSAQVRMFPNRRGLRFRYRVHEQIRPALIEAGIPIVFTDIEVIHTGYSGRETVVEKQSRNLRLLEMELKEHPEDGFLHYLAGMGWMDLGEKGKARGQLKEAWELSARDRDKHHIALGSALELGEMAFMGGKETLHEALEWLEKAERLEARYPRCLYLRGRVSYEGRELDKAENALERLMDSEMPDLLLPLDLTMLKSRGAALLAQIYVQTNRPNEAVSIISQAQEMLKKR